MTQTIASEFSQSIKSAAIANLVSLTGLLHTKLAQWRIKRRDRLLMDQLRAMPNELLRDIGIDPATVPAPRLMDFHPHLIAISQGPRPSRLPTSSR